MGTIDGAAPGEEALGRRYAFLGEKHKATEAHHQPPAAAAADGVADVVAHDRCQ
ncbi:hypothetical protein [Mycobacterium sp.]|uniref:hypothetical protein n=1 Tax=Mycobacterium sp. TaxID=1785 RepID=UPI003C77F096